MNVGSPSAASSLYNVVNIFWIFTSLGRLIWIVFACFVAIFASSWMLDFTNCNRESIACSVSWTRFNCLERLKIVRKDYGSVNERY